MALSDSPRNRRLLANAAGMVLAANLVALFVVGDGGDAGVSPLEAPNHDEAAESAEPRTITLVTDAQGNEVVVDPATPAGRAAIRKAVEAGGTVSTVPAPAAGTSTRSSTVAASNGGKTTGTAPALSTSGGSTVTVPPVLESIIDDTRTTVTTIVRGTVGTVREVTETVDGVVEGTTDSIPGQTDDDQLDAPVDSVTDTVDRTVDTVVDTVEDSTDGVVDTVDGTVGGLSGQSEPAPAPTVGGLTGGLG